jgi:hypothetical protein
MTFGFFFLGEYVAIWTVCCLNIILFWGGYLIIFNYQSIYIYSLKVIALVITFIWIRGSLPRYRYDQLMRLGWKILLPISLGFVTLYSGFFYFSIYYMYYDALIEEALYNHYEFRRYATEMYHKYFFFFDVMAWKQGKIHINFNDLSAYQNLFIKAWRKLKTLEEIWEEYQLIFKMEKHYWAVKASKIFTMKKYQDDYIVTKLRYYYDVSFIQTKIKKFWNLDQAQFFFLTKYYDRSKDFNYKTLIWYSNSILWWYYDQIYAYLDIIREFDNLLEHPETWCYTNHLKVLEVLTDFNDYYIKNQKMLEELQNNENLK